MYKARKPREANKAHEKDLPERYLRFDKKMLSLAHKLIIINK